jgi:serine/threonine protein kinase
MEYLDAVQVGREKKGSPAAGGHHHGGGGRGDSALAQSLTPAIAMDNDNSALDGSDREDEGAPQGGGFISAGAEGTDITSSKFNLAELQRIGSEGSGPNGGPHIALLGTSDDNPAPKYIKLRMIGAGAYGEAWLCKDSESGATVVVKTMNLPGMSKKELSYAQSEIQCLAKVNHTNIIKFYDSQCDDKVLVIAMEFADAGDLRKHIKARYQTQQYLTESEAMFLFLQVAMAIQHIHGQSMLHRDIKSANVLIMSNGLVKLADFGFSRQYEDTVSGAVAKTFCGTPYYLAPELWKNRRYSNKAEVWSLGVFLYELLALDRPFQSPTLKGLFDVVVGGKYPPLPAQFSANARNLVATLLDADAARRPTSLEIFQIPFVQEQLEVLRRLVQDNPQIPADMKNQWEAEAADILARARAHPSFPMRDESVNMVSTGDASGLGPRLEPGKVNASVHHEGPVRKLAAMPKLKWSERFLILENGSLHLCDSAQTPDSRRTLNVDDLQSVCAISEQSAKRRHVFAVHTKDSKCTWLQAPTEQDRALWIQRLQQAMGVL